MLKKKASFQKSEHEIDDETFRQLEQVNTTLSEKRHTLKLLMEKAYALSVEKADEKTLKKLLEEISLQRQEISEIESMWRDEMSSLLDGELYALWHQPDTSLLQLVLDFGAADYLYIVPPEIGAIRLSMSSNLPIPRQSWGDCLDLILSCHGVGIRQLNSFARELYTIKKDPQIISTITSNRQELDLLSGSTRVCFVLNPESPDPRSVFQFLQKFSSPDHTFLRVVGGEILILSSVDEVKELLKLYDFVKTGYGSHDYQLVHLTKMDAREMEVILFSAFQYGQGAPDEGSSLRVVPLNSLTHSLFLFGAKEEVSKAIKLIRDVEAQIEDPQEKTVFWYTAKHSDAEDLASVLAKVYDLLSGSSISSKDLKNDAVKIAKATEEARHELSVKPAVIEPHAGGRTSHKTADGRNNFVVDPKTGSIIMVVEQKALTQIKDLLKKLDVPKKMVKLEVLLFEKKVTNQTKFGLNLLRLGDAVASSTSKMGLSWGASGLGILEFLISHNKGSGIPAYDLAYQFLLGQEDIQINASPSVTTMNQTPAKIAIVEEISINTGNQVEKDKQNMTFSRAQYGIVIQITPTINAALEQEMGEKMDLSYITLDTDITFDTTKRSSNERPDVTRRHIKNHVRIADGQTVIIGGLRRKSAQDNNESIPFLGEIPGIGKLFSTTEMSDSNTEMFIFITPKIIADPVEEQERMKREELRRRPGDCPAFLRELVEAREKEKGRLFHNSLTALFGRQESTSTLKNASEEYEGRS